jgi:hypothetical protein
MPIAAPGLSPSLGVGVGRPQVGFGRAKGQPNWRIVRYADDFVILVHGTRDDLGGALLAAAASHSSRARVAAAFDAKPPCRNVIDDSAGRSP